MVPEVVEYWMPCITEAFWTPPKLACRMTCSSLKFSFIHSYLGSHLMAQQSSINSDPTLSRCQRVPTIDNSYLQCVTSTKQSESLEWLQKERSKHGSMKFRGRKGEITSIQGLAADEISPRQSGQAQLIARPLTWRDGLAVFTPSLHLANKILK